MTGNGLSSVRNPAQSNEIQKVVCRASGGTFTLTFRGKTTLPIPYDAKLANIVGYFESLRTVGPGNVRVILYSTQACLDAGSTWTVEFLQNFGPLPLLVPNIKKLTTTSVSPPFLSVERQIIGTKENAECSGRGICDQSIGVCSCSTNFDSSDGYNGVGTRGDCGYATAAIQYCPGLLSCSAHGECAAAPTYKCLCNDGWTGADCSERLCPADVAWFGLPSATDTAHLFESVECSAMGTCDRSSGTCNCISGFKGSACEYLACPGSTNECNAHGACLDMNTLAALATENGVVAGYSYGNSPNNPYTWDAFKVFGCLCDAGYSGYDCSQRTCPTGDDPATINQFDETQILACTDADLKGTIVLNFRQAVSAPLSPLATSAQVRAALMAMVTTDNVYPVGEVSVERLDPTKTDQLCTESGSQLAVTFLSVHGDLPLITVSSNYIDNIDVTEYIAGSKETLECSGRGMCDRSNGLCTCFQGYGSSNGHGDKGTQGDCGHLMPFPL